MLRLLLYVGILWWIYYKFIKKDSSSNDDAPKRTPLKNKDPIQDTPKYKINLKEIRQARHLRYLKMLAKTGQMNSSMVIRNSSNNIDRKYNNNRQKQIKSNHLRYCKSRRHYRHIENLKQILSTNFYNQAIQISKKYLKPYMKMHKYFYHKKDVSNNKYLNDMKTFVNSFPYVKHVDDNKIILFRLKKWNKCFYKQYIYANYVNKIFGDKIVKVMFGKIYVQGMQHVLNDYQHTYYGFYGENIVKNNLCNTGVKNYTISTDANIPYYYKDGRRGRPNNQNDIVVINKYGVFSLEVKNYLGDIMLNKSGYLCRRFNHSEPWYKLCNIKEQIENHCRALSDQLHVSIDKVHGTLVLIKHHGYKFVDKPYDTTFPFRIENQYSISGYIKGNGVSKAFSSGDAYHLDDKATFNPDLPFIHYELTGNYQVIQYALGTSKLYKLSKCYQKKLKEL